jgi:two-component system sensor histidine kinase BaeS
MKRSLVIEIALAMIVVALTSVGVAGLIARGIAVNAFRAYLETLPTGRGMGPGRQLVLTAAEQTFVNGLSRGILLGALIAFVLAALVSLGIAFYLTRPIDRLRDAVNALASGDLDHRVDIGGSDEVRRLGDAFNDMAASLEESEALRRRLVADVAHEIRNPVAALRAQIEGIAEGVLPADSERIQSLAEDAGYLSRLVGDLQELSAADAGALRYEMGELDLSDLACAEAEAAKMRLGKAVNVSCLAPAPVLVEGDEGRLRQVLRNLLDNAIRHTDSGEISVVSEVADGQARVTVNDTGEGIPEQDLPFVFERFYRADSARARETGGSGIGLAVSSRIIEDHGGQMFAQNRSTGGTSVGFTLPLAS